ncbi:MAG: PAS domain S-box protein, partial [Draconibacterium sp.]|nr:PAS domain S-box protein [Draconibacterium sp.]
LTPELLKFWQLKYDRALSGERVVFEFSNSIGNELYSYQVYLNPIILDGKITGVAALSIDITDQKNTAQSLIESEDKYRAIVENSHNAVYIYQDDNFVFVNNKIYELSGYSKEEIHEMKIWDLIHPDDQKRIQEYGKKRIECEQVPDKYFARVVTKNGDVRDCEFAVRLIRYKNEFAVMGTVQDITERLEAETKLRKSETHLSNIYQNEVVGIALSDNNFNIVSANSFFCNMLGYTEEELMSKTFLGITHPDDAIASKLAVQKAKQEKKSFSKVEKRYIKKNGQFIFCQTTISQIPAEDGESFYNLAIIEDITDRKQANEKLLKNQYYLTKAQEIGKIGSWELNIKKNILKWTDENYKIFGVPLGTKMNLELFINCIHPDDRDYVIEKWSAGLNNEPYDIEHRIIVNNKVKWVREKADIEFDVEGKPIMAIGFTQDITDRKQAEIQLQESELRFKALHNASFGGIAIHDKGIILECNKGLADITGFSVGELVGMDGQLLIEEESRKKVLENILAGYEKPYEVTGLRKNGEQYPVRIEARQIPFKGKQVRVVEFRDITESKQAEIALQESEKHYRTLFNESPIPLWEEDFSEVKKYVDKLKKNKIVDFKEYFDDNPEELREIAGLVKIIDINNATLQLHDANSKEELLNGLESVFTEDSYTAFKQELIAITQGKTKYSFEGVVKTLKGKLRHIHFEWSVLPGYENSLERIYISTVDITESKEMAEMVLQEKNKAQQYLNIADVMLVSVDSSGIVKLINPKGCEVLGYSKEEIIGQNWFDKFLPERLRKNVKAVSRKVFAGEMESVAYYENEILTKSGDERIIAWYNAIYKNDKGDIIGTLSSGEDITERKLTEIKLLKSEDRLSKTLLAANDGMWDWDLITNEVYFDPRYYQMAGYKVDEFSHELAEFQVRIHPEDIENVMSHAQMHIKGEISQFNIEFRFKKKNGDWFWVLGRGKVVEFDKNNKPLRFIGTHTDITKRKLAEKELAENEEKYRSLFDNINVGSALHEIILDEKNNPIDFIWLDVNPAYEKLTQLKRSDIIGKRGLEIIPNLEKKWIDIYGKVALTGKSKSLTDYSEYLNKYWEVKAYSPLKNQFAVALTDITERKLADEELTNHREHLEQLVIERTAEVDEKNKKLSDQIKVFVGRELKIRDLEKKIRLMED